MGHYSISRDLSEKYITAKELVPYEMTRKVYTSLERPTRRTQDNIKICLVGNENVVTRLIIKTL
jgi:hypothetical protein